MNNLGKFDLFVNKKRYNTVFGDKLNMLSINNKYFYNIYNKEVDIDRFNNPDVDYDRYKKPRFFYKVVSICKVSHTLCKGKVYNYKITTCGGARSGWSGLGIYACDKFFKAFSLSQGRCIDNVYLVNNIKRGVIKNNCTFKFKGCKVEFVNRSFGNKFKLARIVNIVQYLFCIRFFNVKSFNSKNNNVMIRLLLSSLCKIC